MRMKQLSPDHQTPNHKPSTGSKKLYRVQIGAYSVKKNADKQLEKAKKAGFKDAWKTKDYYIVRDLIDL